MYKCEICGKKTFIGAKVGKYICLCPSCTIHVTNPPPKTKRSKKITTKEIGVYPEIKTEKIDKHKTESEN